MKDYKLLSGLAACFMLFSTAISPAFALDNQKSGYLYIENANSADIKKLGQDPIAYQLTLHNPDSWVIYTSDGGEDAQGAVSMKEFNNRVKQSVNKNNLEAVYPATLIIQTKDGHIQKYNFQISMKNPVYDEASQTIVYSLYTNSSEKNNPSFNPSFPDPSTFSHASLFIKTNGFCISCPP